MKIVQPSATLEWITQEAIYVIERAGRTCYKSEWKIEAPTYADDPYDRSGKREASKGSAPAFIKMIVKRGHLSVLEHASASFRFVCDRGVTHEMVRHRLVAYSQESTRYCNYGKDRFGGEIQVIEPPFKAVHVDGDTYTEQAIWAEAVKACEKAYMSLIELGQSPQIARSVLPQCLKTEIVMTCNFREFCHVFSLRLDKQAHPQIRQVMAQACRILIEHCPEVFDQFQELADSCSPI